MSGHSKWNNIKRKKEKTDSQKAKVFTKIGREISVCVREGGPDPNVNGKLRELIAKAKQNNVPNDNIDRIIKKASQAGEGDNYEALNYEGYGPGGVAVLVETLTDNRNRTAADLRHYFDKCGGNLGQTGCVSYLFSPKGVIVLETGSKTEDQAMEDILDTGAADYTYEEESIEVLCEPNDLLLVSEALQEKGYTLLQSEVEYLPSTTTALTDPELVLKMQKLLEMLDDNDDVQNVWHNGELPEDEEDD